MCACNCDKAKHDILILLNVIQNKDKEIERLKAEIRKLKGE